MNDMVVYIVERAIEILHNFGFLAGFMLIILESMLPILPLGLFVAFNFSAYGMFVGFLISYFATIFGCILAYFLSKKMFSFYVEKKTIEHEKFDKLVKKMKKINFSTLVLIIALPFSPAFLINIAAGTVKIGLKKFVLALFVAKISIVYFWGMVGKSFIDSLGDVTAMVVIFFSLLGCYFLSKIVSKKLGVE